MLRYKTETRPGLVALYGIRPGNGARSIRTTPEPTRGLTLLIIKHNVCMVYLWIFCNISTPSCRLFCFSRNKNKQVC